MFDFVVCLFYVEFYDVIVCDPRCGAMCDSALCERVDGIVLFLVVVLVSWGSVF